MLCDTEEQIEECPYCHKKIVLTQNFYNEGGVSKIYLTKEADSL